jgi:hypothetical protein
LNSSKEVTMFRVLTILAAIVALAVSAAPASAQKMHYDDISLGTNNDAPTWPFATKRPWWWPS